MKRGRNVPEQPQNIMQAYRLAASQAEIAASSEEKIRAFDKVIRFCSHTDSCRLEPSVKRNVLLYWAYEKVGQNYLQEKAFEQAAEYFERGLKYAGSAKQRKALLVQLAELHCQRHSADGWLEAQKRMIEMLPEAEQLRAYIRLAEDYPSITGTAKVWEKALESVGKGGLPLKDKCNHITEICRRLLVIYNSEGKIADWQRIKKLNDQTERLAAKAAGGKKAKSP